jgi:hypothetical protein
MEPEHWRDLGKFNSDREHQRRLESELQEERRRKRIKEDRQQERKRNSKLLKDQVYLWHRTATTATLQWKDIEEILTAFDQDELSTGSFDEIEYKGLVADLQEHLPQMRSQLAARLAEKKGKARKQEDAQRKKAQEEEFQIQLKSTEHFINLWHGKLQADYSLQEFLTFETDLISHCFPSYRNDHDYVLKVGRSVNKETKSKFIDLNQWRKQIRMENIEALEDLQAKETWKGCGFLCVIAALIIIFFGRLIYYVFFYHT